MVFILSTAYERFDLAQRAIPLGVFAYLVKPISKRTFYATLEKARLHLDSRSGDTAFAPVLAGRSPGADSEIAPEAPPERRFLREALAREMTEDEWNSWSGQFGLSSDKGIVCAVEYSASADNPAPAAGQALAAVPASTGSAFKTFQDKLSLHYRLLADLRADEALFFISGEAEKEELLQHLHILCEELFSGAAYVYGAGSLRRWPELYLSREEAFASINEKRHSDDSTLRERLRFSQIRRRMGVAGAEEISSLFRELGEDIFASYDFELARIKMAALLTILLDDISGSWGAAPDTPPLFNPAEKIAGLRDMAGWEKWAGPAFDKALREAGLRRSGNFPLPLLKAIDFIQSHYAEQIQLGSAAEAAQVTPAYLSRLFSEHLKTNFIDYITDLRLEKSEKLFRESQKSIKEIAFEVGYQDPNYFSRIFRKARGLSPSEYAAEIRNSGSE
jgi:two-component system response regulator YesN